MIIFNWHTFSELSTEQLYTVLALRSDTFVVEQRCAYLDPDGKDRYALHLLGTENNVLAAYLRLFPPIKNENSLSFGRVVIANTMRNKGYGKILIQELLNYCEIHFPNIRITCSAQYHLKHFYEHFGFKTCSQPYKEDGIPHIDMVL